MNRLADATDIGENLFHRQDLAGCVNLKVVLGDVHLEEVVSVLLLQIEGVAEKWVNHEVFFSDQYPLVIDVVLHLL